MVRKWEAAAFFVGLGVIVGVAADVIVLRSVARNAFSTSSYGDYQVSLMVTPGKQRAGLDQVVHVFVSKAGSPVSNTSVSVTVNSKSGTQTSTLQTDARGIAKITISSQTAQTANVSASFQVPGGPSITDQTAVVWAACPCQIKLPTQGGVTNGT